jgi:predicted nucleic-acid-binding Zn-ribbon protein
MINSDINVKEYSMQELYEAYASVDKKRYPENYKAIKAEIAERQKGHYKCPKCSHTGYEVGSMMSSTGSVASILDIEDSTYIAVSCMECGYTEFYKRQSSGAHILLDFLID